MIDKMLEQVAINLGRPVDTACKLIENILDVPSRKLGDLFGDQISFWQWSNRLKIAERASKKLLSKGVHPRALPLDFAVPFLRNAGDVEDSFLQDWWAELLSSAVEDESFAYVAFVNTLHSMSPADAHFLDALLRSQHVGIDGRIESIIEVSPINEVQAKMSFHNLERLGFFTPTGKRLKGFALSFLRSSYADRNLVDQFSDKQKELPTVLVMD